MRIVMRKKPLRRFLRWTQIFLFTSAVSMCSWCGFVLIDTWTFQRSEQRRLERLLA